MLWPEMLPISRDPSPKPIERPDSVRFEWRYEREKGMPADDGGGGDCGGETTTMGDARGRGRAEGVRLSGCRPATILLYCERSVRGRLG